MISEWAKMQSCNGRGPKCDCPSRMSCAGRQRRLGVRNTNMVGEHAAAVTTTNVLHLLEVHWMLQE